MSLTAISLANLRSYELYQVALDANVTLILGKNGSGKTTLLEALYFLHRGTSFRGRDRDMIAHGKSTADIRLDDSAGNIRRVHLQLMAGDKLSKNFTIDDKTTQRMPAKHRLPAVLFEPDELRLLSSSPQRRRQFLDDILVRLYPSYGTQLARYNRTLLQRNELLKQHESMSQTAWESHLFAWDVKFAELAQHIVSKRAEFISLSNQHLSRLYSSMANAEHEVLISYQSAFEPSNYHQQLVHKLNAARHGDALRGFTSVGPHREDIEISLDGYPASETASRGEMRTIMLAYKLLEVELQKELTDMSPLILMDDVFSELDITREQKLMHTLQGYQTIITATDLRDELKIDASIIAL